MENRKDIKRQVQNYHGKSDLSLNLNFNSNNRYYYLILKKAEKLGAASYMLTDHIDDSEPVKSGIRTCALALIKDTYSPEYHSGKKDKKEKIISTLACIEHILALFDIALASKMISTGNHAVIKREYMMLSKTVLELAEVTENKIIFPEDLFIIEKNRKFVTEEPHQSGAVYGADKGHSNSNRHVSYKNVLLKNNQVNVLGKDNSIINRNHRIDNILNLVSKEVEMNIKDIHKHFTNCSEKTIQRELSKMLLKGLIIRRGDKRWSRYSLK